MEYGLIGAKLGHSYSKIIHEMLCGYHTTTCALCPPRKRPGPFWQSGSSRPSM